MMKNILPTILMIIALVNVIHADPYGNDVAYTNATSTLNTTNYVSIVGVTGTNKSLSVPISGIDIDNTDVTFTATVWIVWYNGTTRYPIDKFTIEGPSGTWHLPRGVTLPTTNHFIQAKMDATNSTALDVETWTIELQQFTP